MKGAYSILNAFLLRAFIILLIAFLINISIAISQQSLPKESKEAKSFVLPDSIGIVELDLLPSNSFKMPRGQRFHEDKSKASWQFNKKIISVPAITCRWKKLAEIDKPVFKNYLPNAKPVTKFENKFQKNFSVKRISKDQNLPGTIVNSIDIDNFGRYWISTDGGLAVYNGCGFEVISASNGLLHNYVEQVVFGKGDTTFVASKGGINIITLGSVSSLELSFDNKMVGEITSLCYLENSLYFTNGKELFRLKGTMLSRLESTNFSKINRLRNLDKRLFVCAEDGLFKLDRSIELQQLCDVQNVLDIYKVNQQFLLGTLNSGLCRISGDSLNQLMDSKRWLDKQSVTEIVSIRKDEIVLNTQWKGTYLLKDNFIQSVNQTIGFPIQSKCVQTAYRNTLLLGGLDGLFLLNTNLTHFTYPDVLSSEIPISVGKDLTGSVWTSTINGGITIINDSTYMRLNKENGLFSSSYMSICHSKSGRIFLGSSGSGQGVEVIWKNRVYNMGPSAGFKINNVNVIKEDNKGNIWIGTNENGLYLLEHNTLFNYGPMQGLSSNCIYGIECSDSGDVFIGTNGDGLFKINSNSHKIEKLVTSSELNSKVIYSITHLANSGKTLVGTYGDGFMLNSDEPSVKYNNTNGLSDDNVVSSGFFGNHIFIGTSSGLSILSVADNKYVFNNLNKNNVFFEDDFFPNALFIDGSNDCFYAGINRYLVKGRISHLTQKDSLLPFIYKIENRSNTINNYPGSIESLPSRFNASDNSFRVYFGYSGTAFYSSDLKYEITLINHQLKPMIYSASEMAKGLEFNNVSPGNYQLNYKMQRPDGSWTKLYTYEFRIMPPWYQTIWAYGSYATMFVFSLFGFSRLRNQHLIKKNIQLESVIKQRTEVIVKQKEDIEQKNHIVEEKNKELAEKNHEIIESITYAKRLQEAILPPDSLMSQFLNDFFVLYMPKDIVAGDFYWFETVSEKDNTFYYIAAADCTGHGVPGAMVSMVCFTALNRALIEFKERDTAGILNRTRELVIETFQKSEDEVKDGMDISLIRLSSNSNAIQWSGANNPLYIVSAETGTLTEVKANKQPIGKYYDMTSFDAHEIEVKKGDMLYVFSDGYADQFGGDKGKKFKTANLKVLLTSLYSQPAKVQMSEIRDTFNNWKADYEQVDDICVIGIKID
jgi:serine phosphatase RsbU (regulator of sigma subunit)/ligand-binding sensor domain-containing protein